MSDNWLILIPTSPDFIPERAAVESARNALSEFAPEADEVSAEITPETQFIDCGGNLEKIVCPFCFAEIEIDFWKSAMDRSYESKFSDLKMTTPCCSHESNLNDLVYEWPQGFAKFSLKAMNPNIDDLKTTQLACLTQILETRLRRIWRHI